MEANQPELVLAAKTDWRNGPLSPRQAALCTFAERLTRSPASCGPADLDALRAHGLDDEALLDLTQVVAYFNYINRVADGLGVDLEPFMPPANTRSTRGPSQPGPTSNP